MLEQASIFYPPGLLEVGPKVVRACPRNSWGSVNGGKCADLSWAPGPCTSSTSEGCIDGRSRRVGKQFMHSGLGIGDDVHWQCCWMLDGIAASSHHPTRKARPLRAPSIQRVTVSRPGANTYTYTCAVGFLTFARRPPPSLRRDDLCSLSSLSAR